MSLQRLPNRSDIVGSSVAIFGLSGNPPTGKDGHLGIVKYLTSLSFDEVWIVPVFVHMLSAKRDLLKFEHRMEMCEINFLSQSNAKCRVRVLPIEKIVFDKRLGDTGHTLLRIGTVDVVDFLRELYPDITFHLVLGSDTFSDLMNKKWKESDRLLTMVNVEVIDRKDFPFAKEAVQDKLPSKESPFPDITYHAVPLQGAVSSSTARRLLGVFAVHSFWPYDNYDAELQRLLSPGVYAYIRTHELYEFSNSVYVQRKFLKMAAQVLMMSAAVCSVMVPLYLFYARFLTSETMSTNFAEEKLLPA